MEKPGEAVRCRCIAQPVIDEQSFRLVPLKNSYTMANENDIIQSRLGYSFAQNINVKNVPPKYIATVSQESADSVIRYAESQIAAAEIENAVIVTKSGEVYHCTGELNSLASIEELGGKLNGATVTHNHPKESVSDGTFSDADLKLFKNCKLKKLRGIDEKFVYELNRDAKNIDSEPMLGEMNEFTFRHWEVIRIAKNFGLGYRRWSK